MSGSVNDIYDPYEAVIGLEVHAQLLTESKIFSSESAAFGHAPNTQISAVTLGHPGTLPFLNTRAVTLAIKMGLACRCSISREMYFDRKHYFYPDLPKGYQITQLRTPICEAGAVRIKASGNVRDVRLHHIHLEEDAGKSMHDQDPDFTFVDYNRAGIPLIEIVSEPDMHSGEEAYAYLTELRRLVRYLDICDGNMEEGSLRCDANISVRLKGDPKLGPKVEVKNMNSVRNVKRAVEYEIKRQIGIVAGGGTIRQQTRSFDAANGTTFELRSKEMANDYRYFPEPDLAPLRVSEEMLEAVRKQIPSLPEEREERYTGIHGLREQDAAVIAEDRPFADFFEETLQYTSAPKATANWMLGPVKSYLNEKNTTITAFPLPPEKLGALILLVESGKLNFSVASSRIFPALAAAPGEEPLALARTMNLLPETNTDALLPIIEEVLAAYPDKVKAFRNGKKGLLGMFVGEVMKRSGSKADPRLTNRLLLEKLS